MVKKRLADLETQTADPALWENPDVAKKIMQEKAHLEDKLTKLETLESRLSESIELISLGEEEEEDDIVLEGEKEIQTLMKIIERLETERLLGGEADANNAFLEIHSGAGGTESQDWAQMLMRMYLRWAERAGFKTEIIDENRGEEAGIKSVVIKLTGMYAYGLGKTESGVHRLVRISPFDSQNRRHTSFSSVFVYPEIDDQIEIDINPSDLRIDTYRASGAGGQHVNTTDSAVRITHTPTNIVVQCQSERSQHQNKDRALAMLRARLYEHELQQKEAEKAEVEASKTDNGWGHQIRSYVMHPYQMVKDLRTQIETSNTTGVMDGDLDHFIQAALAYRVSHKREG